MTANLATQGNNPQLSIVIPVYNEEDGLQALFDRLYPALDEVAAKRNIGYEVVFLSMMAVRIDPRGSWLDK